MQTLDHTHKPKHTSSHHLKQQQNSTDERAALQWPRRVMHSQQQQPAAQAGAVAATQQQQQYSSQRAGGGAGGGQDSDLAFLDNIEELNTNWPDYQVWLLATCGCFMAWPRSLAAPLLLSWRTTTAPRYSVAAPWLRCSCTAAAVFLPHTTCVLMAWLFVHPTHAGVPKRHRGCFWPVVAAAGKGAVCWTHRQLVRSL